VAVGAPGLVKGLGGDEAAVEFNAGFQRIALVAVPRLPRVYN